MTGWRDCAAIARSTYTFYELVALHPKLRAYYDEPERAEDREAASDLFMQCTAEDEGTVEMKESVLEEWLQMGLLNQRAQVVESHEKAASWWKGRKREAAEVEAQMPAASMEDKMRAHRRSAFYERKKVEEEKETKKAREDAAAIRGRKKEGIIKDATYGGAELSGKIMFVDEERGFGELYSSERKVQTMFRLDAVSYGMKKVRAEDKVLFSVTQFKGGKGRDERAQGVRLEEQRELSLTDIVAFLQDCKVATTAPEAIIMKILTSTSDWRTMCRTLEPMPEEIGKNMSWYEAVMALVMVASFPGLEEMQYTPVLRKFFCSLQGTCFPQLVLEACRVASDARDVAHGKEIAVFVAHLRRFASETGRHTDISAQYYEEICGLLDRLVKAHLEMTEQPKDTASKIKDLCKKIGRDPAERNIFPTLDCFSNASTGLDDPSHPMYYGSMGDTQRLPWDSVYDYVGCHFNLLKADCFVAAVKSIRWRLEGGSVDDGDDSKFKPIEKRDMDFTTTMYENVRVVGEALGDRDIWLTVRFEKPANFNTFSMLKKGSLVCLMHTEFREPKKLWWAEIPFDDVAMTDYGLVALNVIEGDRDDLIACFRQSEVTGRSRNCLMFETKIFIGGVKPVLEALANLQHEETLPFHTPLLLGAADKQNRHHVRKSPEFIPGCYRDAFDRIVKRMLKKFTYEPGQERALRWLPNRPLLLVQGPPGTGKSFIGCRLVECIAEFRIRMASGHLKNEYNVVSGADVDDGEGSGTPGPIVVLTYKNHSLDEFLLDVLNSGVWCGDLRDEERCACKFPQSRFCCPNCCDRLGHHKKLVRVGSRSQQRRLIPYNLLNRAKPKGNHKGKLKSLLRDTERLATDVRNLDNNNLDEDIVRRFFSTEQQLSFLSKSPNADMLALWNEWLAREPCQTRLQPFFTKLRQAAGHIIDMNVDPDAIDEAFVKDKASSDLLKEEYEAAAAKARAQMEQNDGAAAKTNFTAIAADHKTLDDVDDEFIRRLKDRRNFYGTFVPTNPLGKLPRDETADDTLNYPGIPEGEKMPFELRTGKLHPPDFAQCEDVWTLSIEQRRQLADYWIANLRDEKVRKIKDNRNEFDAVCVLDQHQFNQSRLEALQKADIIGLTTTGAAMNQTILQAVKPSVLMVEEAAEILEGQILSCFSPSIKQVILIGDHKQLRPGCESQMYAEVNKLDTSMFQRLIETCDVPCARLTEQRRMKPGIADLVRPIYEGGKDKLTDFHTLKDRTMPWGDGKVASIPGMPCEVQFWAHSTPEQQSDIGLSVMNKKEVEMVRFLVLWMVGTRGLRPAQLTVLTPYLGQTRVIKKALKALGHPYSEVSVLTVDRFQGDENDVIIVSMARTNKLTGFLKLENRMCVACSRARFNFFIIGSPGLLEQADHWARTLQIIRSKSDKAISEDIRLQRPGSEEVLTMNSARDTFPDPREDATWSEFATE
eukprot:TRINITY_DN10124_c0_g1_i1.p1 TRINITY_DN10124_c0_g1~~TRINITY_DN10124_c0_g1_i1.p1  ORF type:complete len:1446 (+),score=491.91 TRINITY_DN10124_c0_g1_i1:64-4401(+)